FVNNFRHFCLKDGGPVEPNGPDPTNRFGPGELGGPCFPAAPVHIETRVLPALFPFGRFRRFGRARACRTAPAGILQADFQTGGSRAWPPSVRRPPSIPPVPRRKTEPGEAMRRPAGTSGAKAPPLNILRWPAFP